MQHSFWENIVISGLCFWSSLDNFYNTHQQNKHQICTDQFLYLFFNQIWWFGLREAPLNWSVSNFRSTVFEGFCDLFKTVETSVSDLDEVYVCDFIGSQTP